MCLALIIGQFLFYLFSVKFLRKLCKRNYDLLEINNVLPSLQFGFRKKHSTSHTLISMTENIRNTIDNGKCGYGVFIDVKKAFDIVDHFIL